MKTVLVTGKNSQLAQCIHQIVYNYKGLHFIFKDSKELDITNSKTVDLFFKSNSIDYCINCAAYTAVDKAETEQEKAYSINVTGVRNLSKTCEVNNTKLIHISTDFVFDGQSHKPYLEDDKPNPIGIYGLTKYKGEQEVIKNLENYFIIRTSWLYSEYGNNFLKTILKLSKEKEEIHVVDDQIGSPTYARDLAETILKFIITNSINFGIYHYSNEGYTNWFGFAKAILNFSKIKMNAQPISSDNYLALAERPSYSVLDKTKIRKELNIEIDDWRLSLKKAILNLNE